MLALLKQSLSAVDSRAIGLISASAACGTRREPAHPSPSTHSRSDLGLSNFLHQPNVSVWIGEREEGAVVAMFGLGSWELTAAGVEMKEVADVRPAYEELSSRGLDISDDQVQALEGTGRLAVSHDGDRARRAGRRHLHHAKVAGSAVVDVRREAGLLQIEGLGAVDIRDGNHNEFQLPIHGAASLS